MSQGTIDAAIVGGGIAGLVLALTLHKHSVKCTIYELRQAADIANPGAIGLAPNGLRPLDELGLHEQLRNVSWPLQQMQWRDQSDEVTASIDIGSVDIYGYEALRIVRRRMHDVLLAAVQSAGIEIVSGKKFSHVVSSTPSSVTFSFTDNTQVTSSLLIGADGIHSAVRNTIDSSITPEYKGSVTMMATLSTNPFFALPQTPSLQTRMHSISINMGPKAAFLAIAQDPSGQELSLGLDRTYQVQSREQWDALLSDKQKQYDIFMEGYDDWPETIQMLMRAVKPEDMYRSWPFYAIPDLEQWSTPDRKVILLGDAAHAVPPSAGQGACMAIEDAWSLGVVLGRCQSENLSLDGEAFKQMIGEWQTERRNRVDLARTITRKMGNVRLPPETKEKLGPEECFVGGEEQKRDVMRLYGYEYVSSKV